MSTKSSTNFIYSLSFNDSLHWSSIEIGLNPQIIEQVEKLVCGAHAIPGTSALCAVHESRFSLHEDKLLLKCSLQSKPNYVKEYKKQSKANPKLFPKKNITNQILKERVQQLRAEGLRYQILARAVHEEAAKQHNDDSADGHSASLPTDPGPPPQHTSLNKPLAPSDTLVNIVLTGQDFPTTRLQSTEKLLTDNSLYLRRILSKMEHRVKESTETTGGVASFKYKELGFSEYDDKYRGHQFFHAFNPDIFSRFLTFCENADIQDKYFSMLEKWDQFHNESQKTLHDALAALKNNFSDSLSKLTDTINKEKVQLTSVYETCLERDVQRLKTLYRSQLDAQLSKLDIFSNKRQDEMDQFFNEEIKLTEELYTNHQQIRKLQLQKERQDTETLLNHTLPPENLPSIFILSDTLQAEELKTICMNRIADDFDFFRKNKAFSSSLISANTLTQLMTRLSTETLLSLTQDIDYSFPTSFVTKEVEYRRSLARNNYHSKPLPTLIAMSTDPEKYEVHFPDILREELAARRGSKPKVSMKKSPFIGDDELTVTHSDICKSYITHYATLSRDYTGWSRWYFEVNVKELHAEYGSAICVGFGVPYEDPAALTTSDKKKKYDESSVSLLHLPAPDHSIKQKIIGLTQNYRNKAGYALSSEGFIYHEGNREVLPGFQLHSGDVIGCALDQVKKRVDFFLNGKSLKGLQIQDELFVLSPAVSVWHTHKGSECSVVFNFSGPFEHEYPGYEAYSETEKRR
uniref:SPRY domain-containing protein n=1 Tax=Percolomonas cosmopolitus TaxID=63605 RepID=A0A7S1PHG8_9EUKA|mmetsp:Transcript_5513/g.20711  ORF Transcript_5513/g.20711 Transcript_5513/m.20711 type:complete len:746 (+) Transcript_5513:70-2307(+)|eukprot:CAMPEP_0117451568 /NCGR_PEP_ID=MMETSP0759-20121206/9081_1 /TAXON_ID=63605 /ORGANISM="Percolomonas cosmopolitus, Strain WS" /LENGTH=745 /DNA_ID=CAMNT_0005244185 /DNA_START=37 /DNA_END=2274 /DNA_ORIENTATION=+